ncbi:hypothetical protein [Parasitella parasitica]|uniref:Cytochrome P450 n=1 Tax=Parasitella parasitica TaxID=35722 RepID=A0A0B7NQ22_9FUNG|nr:hypothetical protein [Parasitella parasitica]
MDLATQIIGSIKLPHIDKDHILPVVSIAAATTILYQSWQLISSSKNLKKQGLKEIPIPGSCYPIVGHVLSLGRIPGETVKQWHKECGSIIQLKMGQRTWIVINDPVLLHKLFVTHGNKASFRPHLNFAHTVYSGGGKNIAFAQPGKIWQRNRAAALSILQPKQIENYLPSIRRESLNLAQRLLDYTERDGGVDPFKHVELNFINVILGHGFGKTYDCVEDEEFIEVSQIVEDSIRYLAIELDITNFLPQFTKYGFLVDRKLQEIQELHRIKRNTIFKQYIEETEHKEGPNFVKALNESGYTLDLDEKLVVLFELVAAGTDTFTTTGTWMFAILCHYPQAQKKAQDEIDAFISNHGRIPDFNERSEVPYILAVIRECMRFRPTTFFGLSHSVVEDLVVDGYLFPKDCFISAHMASLHQNPNFYENPEKFCPERFLNNTKSMHAAANGKLEERDHFNFGFGRRLCTGIHLAETELFYSLIQVLSRSFIEPVSLSELPDLDGIMDSGITVRPVPYKIKFTKRTNVPV